MGRMFRKTKIRLVSLYSLVFFLILTAFSMSMYLFMYRTTYASIDHTLTEKINQNIQIASKEVSEAHEREAERRVIYLFFDNKEKLIISYPRNSFLSRDYKNPALIAPTNNIHSVHIDGHPYRILTVRSHQLTLENKHVDYIQIICSISPEVDLLKDMLFIMIAGIGFGLILSILAGIYFANKALIPIQKSWEKQSRFVADASHELRTPLAVIQTHLELLFRHPDNTIEQESETIYKSLTEVKRVNKLVEDLLTLAKTDSNEQVINPGIFSIDELLHLIAEQFAPIAELKRIFLEESIETNLLFFGDKERLHQLFVILLDNAIKYTPPEGKVSILAKKEGYNIKIIIRDTGIGISAEDLPYIFDRFYRSDKSRTRSVGGTGLGLSIAKWIVKVHSGQILVESKPKIGTSFIIKLPRKEALANKTPKQARF